MLPCCIALLFSPAASAMPDASFDTGLAANVFATALAFMEPRTLEPVPVSQLTLWGLRGLTTLDPQLTTDAQAGTLRLAAPDRVLAVLRIPPANDVDGWAVAAAQLSEAAWASSAAIRSAGTEGVIRTFFDELFNHLDPYSRYEPPAAAEIDEADRSGTNDAGLRLARRGGVIVVTGVVPRGPADAAGLRPGDAILAVDGRPTRRAAPATVTSWIGARDPDRAVLVTRPPHGRIHRVVVPLTAGPPQTVFATREGDALVLRITGFSSNTGASLARAIEAGLAARPAPRGVVFDLRGNRGGLLRQAVAAARTVLAAGLIATTFGRDPQAVHVFRADGTNLATGLPVVVLVDGRSASAAEILAAALSDERRAVVIGSATLGKGLVQTVTPLPDGGELFVTWSRVLAPRGWPIQDLGVLPEVCTSLGSDALARQLGALAGGVQPMARALAEHERARAPMAVSQVLQIRDTCPAAVGQDMDLHAAHFLIDTPVAYQTALLPPLPRP